MPSTNEGVCLVAAETDTDIRRLTGPIEEAVDTPLDSTETHAGAIRGILRKRPPIQTVSRVKEAPRAGK